VQNDGKLYERWMLVLIMAFSIAIILFSIKMCKIEKQIDTMLNTESLTPKDKIQ
jgi:hypothetical protein